MLKAHQTFKTPICCQAMSDITLLGGEELKMKLRPHMFSFFNLYFVFFLLATPQFFAPDKEKTMILGDVPSPITYLDESKAELATQITDQERLEIKAIEGKGIDYIVRSSLNKVFPLREISENHFARVE
mgnify:CR=1 FL=1